MKRQIFQVAVMLLSMIALSQAKAATITEFYYLSQVPSFSNLIINNHYNPADPNNPNVVQSTFQANGTPQLMANNIAVTSHNYQFLPLSPTVWSGAQWTGLEPTDRTSNSQRGLGVIGSLPTYGATAFQIDGYKVGMHLNTFAPDANSPTLPTKYSAASLQYAIGFSPQPQIWLRDDLLCMSGQANIASSYSAGSVNQVIFTMLFFNSMDQQSFFLNVILYDSRAGLPIRDVVHLDTQGTGLAIVISYAQSQTYSNPNVIYTSSVPGYGNLLTPAYTGSFLSGNRDYGFCISKPQFQRILNDINVLNAASMRPLLSADLTRYRLHVALIGPEIETTNGRGRVGMSVNQMYVYRLRP
ncbi:MAG: hypothetical protein JNM52_06200 [Betaproteobacteria bacterium]|nr:hypothetical protein [Betaproteobacteria bacterium]